jgi:CubicO group peptidase (beta-lactamase class C family)
MRTTGLTVWPLVLTLAGELFASDALADPTYDFTAVTQLAQGALAGQNVQTPVPGFDLMLMKDGRVVYHRSFGGWWLNRLANADSATKTVSGAVIMSLTDSSPQPFSLDTRLSEYIPAFNGDKAVITIRQAFSHTSGIDGSSAVGNEDLTLQQAALQIAAAPLAFSPPNSAFSYGGTSMHAAGAVVELAGQAPWNTLFTQRIAGPVGMTNTQYVLTSPSNPRIAGGCESNARDFAAFMEMLRRGGVTPGGTRVLSAAAVAQMFTRQSADPIEIINSPVQSPTADQADYGVGVWLDERGSQGQLLGAMAAGARGFSAWIDFDDGMVGVFATDRSTSGNCQPLLYMLRAAAQAAVRSPVCGPADVGVPGGFPGSDGALDNNDFVAFISYFFDNDARADLGLSGGLPGQDGAFDNNDFIAFINAFFSGC